MSRLFVQGYEAATMPELQQRLLDSLSEAQRTYAIADIQVSHAHHSHLNEAGVQQHHFSALVVLRTA